MEKLEKQLIEAILHNEDSREDILLDVAKILETKCRKAEIVGIITGLEIALKAWGESGCTFTALRESKEYYQEELEKLEQ